jgi:hypothetical protein
MIQLYSLMWVIAVFAAVIGFLRGWNREVIVTAGVVLAMFMLFQFDSLIRGTVLVGLGRDQVFFIQAGLFMLIVYFAYRTRSFSDNPARSRPGMQESILGAFVGFANGYLIGGMLWYFLDINEYPFPNLFTAPPPGSPSVQALSTIPMVVASGGVTGTGDFLAVVVIGLFLLVILAL